MRREVNGIVQNNGILPLDSGKIRTIGVIGPNADSRTALEGNFCGTADRYITFLEGIQDAFDGRVLYAQEVTLQGQHSCADSSCRQAFRG